MSLGRIKHKRSKVAEMWRNELRRSGGAAVRTAHIRVQVQRDFQYSKGGYRAEACVVSKPSHSRHSRPCGYGNNTSPTKAIKSALTALTRSLK